MGSPGIPYHPLVQRIHPSTAVFFPESVYECVFFFSTRVCTWTLVVHPQTNFLTVETFCSNPVTSSSFGFKVSCDGSTGS